MYLRQMGVPSRIPPVHRSCCHGHSTRLLDFEREIARKFHLIHSRHWGLVQVFRIPIDSDGWIATTRSHIFYLVEEIVRLVEGCRECDSRVVVKLSNEVCVHAGPLRVGRLTSFQPPLCFAAQLSNRYSKWSRIPELRRIKVLFPLAKMAHHGGGFAEVGMLQSRC